MIDSAPPAAWVLGGHPVRWSILRSLENCDRMVDELATRTGHPQNLVSYHLAKLKTAGMVTASRSARDGRATYYSLDVQRCAKLLSSASRSFHPALETVSVDPAHPLVPARVLFLCTANSARSQMAEAFVRTMSQGVIEACSAGSDPAPVHPGAIAAMRERGIDISIQESKHLDAFAGQQFDAVVTVCDIMRERCPSFPGPEPLHWSIPDPARPWSGMPEADRFDGAAHDIERRVRALLATLRVER